MAEFIITPYKPCINYERGFDPDKGKKCIIQIDYTRSVTAANGAPDIHRMMTQKDTT